jgi:hypothetical protein
MIHRGPIPAPVHGVQRVIERFVAARHCRRRRRGERWGVRERVGRCRCVGRDAEGGIMRRDVRPLGLQNVTF